MPLADEKGTAVFPEGSRYGHFIFHATTGKDRQTPALKIANIVECIKTESPVGWKADYKPLHDNQLTRKCHNPQIVFPIAEVPDIIRALVKEYEAVAMKSAPMEAKPFTAENNESPIGTETASFIRGSSEF
jgi:hypothetical protein